MHRQKKKNGDPGSFIGDPAMQFHNADVEIYVWRLGWSANLRALKQTGALLFLKFLLAPSQPPNINFYICVVKLHRWISNKGTRVYSTCCQDTGQPAGNDGSRQSVGSYVLTQTPRFKGRHGGAKSTQIVFWGENEIVADFDTLSLTSLVTVQ